MGFALKLVRMPNMSVIRVDSISKLMEVEDLFFAMAQSKTHKRKNVGDKQLDSVLSGECTMYCARMQNSLTSKDMAMMIVYVGMGVAVTPLCTTPNDKLLLLHAYVENWLCDVLGVCTLYTTLLGEPMATMQLDEILLEGNTTDKKKKAMRNAAVGILFKTKQRNRKWNSPKSHWINRLGQRVDSPKWLGENAFVADFWHMPLRCVSLKPPPPPNAVEFTTFQEEGPPLAQKQNDVVYFKCTTAMLLN